LKKAKGGNLVFTGIIEEIGKVKSIKNGITSSVITIEANSVTKGTKPGDSIAVNGVCLTAVKISDTYFDADVMGETLRRSNLKTIKSGEPVNLERAMSANGRFGGHIVTGHIDDVGVITNYEKEDIAVWVTVECSPDILKYMVNKGSVALDGISLTVASVKKNNFSVSVIPHTGSETTLLSKNTGAKINIECDIIGKYVENLMLFKEQTKTNNTKINMNFLSENGFL